MKREEIAIIGMGCRFPGGASNPEAYWDILKNGVDATGEVPAERWSLRRFFDEDATVPGKIYTSRGGYLRESIQAFDARFFGISPREAAPMDPQQRLLLEIAWEAFEDAGIVPEHIRGSKTGVYVGGFTIDNKIHLLNSLNREAISSHTAISATLDMLANRLSYTLDLRGPSMTVSTACSSSLVALHLAVQALRQGECDLALAGGVSLMFRPAYSVAMCKGGFLSPDGRCKSFDIRGDGYGRGEGAGVLILKPLQMALRDRDTIYAVVMETGVNQDGKTDGITLPNISSQIALIKEVCVRAGIKQGDVQYVEAHGTGTRAGDTTEARALSTALAQHRSDLAEPLLVGSAKSNIGHLEAAAGVAGVIKTALALKKQKVPPSINFREPPESLDLDALRLEIPTKLRSWPPHSGRAIAAINSFGYGGTNAHVLLTEAPATEPVIPAEPVRPLVIPVSARSDASLTRQLLQLYQWLSARPKTVLADLGYTLARRRSHHKYRAAIVASTTAELLEHLRCFFDAGEARSGFVAAIENRFKPSLVFVYTGMGPQSWGMGMELIAAEPVAAAALNRCDTIWAALAGWSLKELFADGNGKPMREPKYAQPANFAFQVMLTEVMRAYGLSPAAAIGHSTGEIAAAWAVGSLCLEDALRITWHRSRLQQSCAGSGRMLAVGLSADEVSSNLAGNLDIAAINGPRMVTVSGEEAELKALSDRLEKSEVFNRMLMVDVAYHSRYMESIREEFLDSIATPMVREPQLPLYSTVTGKQICGAEQDADYWWRNIRQPVRFATAIDASIADGHNLFLEVGPHPVLAPSIIDCLQVARKQGCCLASIRRKESESAHIAATMAELFARGVDFDWSQLYPAGNQVPLLTYPWDREYLWTESEGSRLDRLGNQEHPILTRRANEAVPTWDGDFSQSFHAFLQDHSIQGEPVFPAAGYVELALVASPNKSASVAIENVEFRAALGTFVTPIVRLHLNEDDGSFTIYSRDRKPDATWNLNATGKLLKTPAPPRHRHIDLNCLRTRCPSVFDIEAFYERTGELGLEYGTAFRCIRKGWIGYGEAILRLGLGTGEVSSADDYYIHPVILDGALQSALALQLNEDSTKQMASLPVSIGQLRFHRKAGATVWCHVVLKENSADLILFNDEGTALVELFDLRSRPIPMNPAGLLSQSDLLYANKWQPQEVNQLDRVRATKWLVFADDSGIADLLGDRAVEKRTTYIMVKSGSKYRKLSENHFEISRGSRQDMARLLREVDNLDGALYLWSCDIPDSLDGLDSMVTGRDDAVDLLHLVQILANTEKLEVPTIVVCTIGTQIVLKTDRVEQGAGQNSLWSAVRAAQLELPHINFKLIDLATRLPFVAATHLEAECHTSTHESEVAFRRTTRYVNRVVRLGSERYREHISTPGMRYVLKSFERGGVRRRGFVEVEQTIPAAGEVEVSIHSCALGNSDRLSLKKLNSQTMPVLNLQCSGQIAAVGKGVESLRVGQNAILLTPQKKLASHVVIAATSVLPYPEWWSPGDSGAIFDWIEAYYALFEVGKLQAGQWLLVHQADSGLGLAAVQLACWAGAKVIATVRTEEGRSYVRSLGCDLISDSGSLIFCDDVQAATKGEGVDLVLSPLAGELLAASLDTLKDGGTFIDVSPHFQERRESIPISYAEAEIRFVRLNLARICQKNSAAILRILEGLQRYQNSQSAFNIPIKSFLAPIVEDAFKACLLDSHIGRLVIDMADKIVPLVNRLTQPVVRPDASYLVTGGFGGIGLETIRWLVARGAKHIAVLSRSGPSSDRAQETVRRLEESGVRILHERVDITDREKLNAALDKILVQSPPLRGVIHAAGVLADANIEVMDVSLVDRAMDAKAKGSLNLHLAFESKALDFFVCYASIAATLGNAGQFNYAAANGFLQGLVMYRRARGLSGTCINWGPVAGVGMAARDEQTAEHLARAGLKHLPLTMVFEILEEALIENWGTFDAVDIDWAVWSRQATIRERLRLSEVLLTGDAGDEESTTALRNKMFNLGTNDRRAFLFALVVEIVAEILSISQSSIDSSSNLGDLGTDSIMAAEISQAIFGQTGVRLRILYLTRGPSLTEMVDKIEEGITSGKQPQT